jgi:hypothetical protein
MTKQDQSANVTPVASLPQQDKMPKYEYQASDARSFSVRYTKPEKRDSSGVNISANATVSSVRIV